MEEFRQRIANTLQKHPYLVVVDTEGTIQGYASAFKRRAAYDWAVETSIYVRMGEEV